jgi:nucleotide-binding universal stress UspA family protein
MTQGGKMFKHILLPTDGSEMSEIAIFEGIKFAESIHAKVTGYYAIPEFHLMTFDPGQLEESRARYQKDSTQRAEHHLALIQKTAAECGVPCETFYEIKDQPYEGIIQAAESKGCDLISMASHGRSGIKNILIGSVTQKVLTHTQLPVLVFR